MVRTVETVDKSVDSLINKMAETFMRLTRSDSQRNWDIFYLNMARYVSTKSKDPSTKTGAVITYPDGLPVSFGFNGFPRGMKDDPELYADREKKYSRTVHCEVNAQILSHQDITGCTLYTWPFASCDRCAVQMIQAGIKRFVFPEMPPDKAGRWGSIMELAQEYMHEAGCEVVVVPLKEIPDVVLKSE
jgi:dCMP deaminase